MGRAAKSPDSAERLPISGPVWPGLPIGDLNLPIWKTIQNFVILAIKTVKYVKFEA